MPVAETNESERKADTDPGDKARAQLIAFAECLTDAGRHGDAQAHRHHEHQREKFSAI
jgi:hypothetical protein